jgi:hypothetical protein
MKLKRDSQGVVDGIVAEDIGKFPDTNLAESLQRISGVSIDRSIGEGSKVTVRGVGPDFNLVLLNGRQMPGSSLQDTGASNSRSFDFANLASEAVAAVEVYKTSRSETPTGGIGAAINIKTTRPLDAPGLHTSVGVKLVNDTSADNLPSALQGDSFTPEISGIFSNTFADGKFGVALTASYQVRDLGYNQAAVGNGWRPFAGDENNWGTVPNEGAPGSENVTNHPAADDIYSVPQNLGYSVNGIERKRTNGQLTLQFAPTDAITTTLDYTYSENKVAQQRNELSVWFNFGPSVSSWTDGPVAGPILYSETINGPNYSDTSMGGAKFATKNENESLGFNFKWDATDRLGFELDYHDSSAESGADSPYGSNAVLGVAGFFRGTTTGDFSKDFPVISSRWCQGPRIRLKNSGAHASRARASVTATCWPRSSRAVERPLRFHRVFTPRFRRGHDGSEQPLGFSNVQRTPGGGTSPARSRMKSGFRTPSRPTSTTSSGSSNPNLFNSFFTGISRRCGSWRPTLAIPPCTRRSPDVHDRPAHQGRCEQRLRPVRADLGHEDSGRNGLGLRYEKTEVTSSALVPTATGINWVANNEFSVIVLRPGLHHPEGEYDYLLPSADFAFDVRDDMKLRLSYGEPSAVRGWGDIQGGQTLNQLARINGGTGAQGNPH